jgi:hypothetical protein
MSQETNNVLNPVLFYSRAAPIVGICVLRAIYDLAKRASE